MPKNQFQRPQPINHANNVPRHGQQQVKPQKLQPRARNRTEKPGLPSIEKLLDNDRRR